jgi:hypothetical protein
METTQKPVRAVTSASNLFRRALCPGSAALEAQFSQADSEYSLEGTMLHSLFMRPESEWPPLPAPLTDEQRSALDSANFQGWDFVRQFAEDNGIPEDADYIDEHEATLEFYDKGEPLFPGHADFIRKWPKYHALVIVDAKFGFMEVDDAADNLQLASYATMNVPTVGALSGLKAGVAIVQPRNFGPKRSQAQYDDKGLLAAGVEIVRVFRESEKPNAPRNPDMKACHFCRAKTRCPEYTAKYMQLSPTLSAAVTTLDNDQLARMYEAVKFAAKVGEEVRDEMRARIRAGGLPGFKLGNSGDTRRLVDGVGLYQAMAARFPTAEHFAMRYNRCLEMVWGRMEELFAVLAGVSEAKAKEFVKEIAAPFVETTEKEKRILVDKPSKKLR